MLCVERMNAQRLWMRSGQGRSRRRRWRAAPASTRVQPWTTLNNYSLSGLLGATTIFAPAVMGREPALVYHLTAFDRRNLISSKATLLLLSNIRARPRTNKY